MKISRRELQAMSEILAEDSVTFRIFDLARN